MKRRSRAGFDCLNSPRWVDRLTMSGLQTTPLTLSLSEGRPELGEGSFHQPLSPNRPPRAAGAVKEDRVPPRQQRDDRIQLAHRNRLAWIRTGRRSARVAGWHRAEDLPRSRSLGRRLVLVLS